MRVCRHVVLEEVNPIPAFEADELVVRTPTRTYETACSLPTPAGAVSGVKRTLGRRGDDER